MSEMNEAEHDPKLRAFCRAASLLGAAALPLVFLPGCKKAAAPETQVTVQAEHPEQGPIAEHITADAVLAPLAQAAIAPKISAPVRKFYVQRGSRVKAGQLLATLENSDLAAAAMDNKGSYDGGAGSLRHGHQGAGAGRYAKGRVGPGAGQGQSRSEPEHREEPQATVCRRRDSGPRSGHCARPRWCRRRRPTTRRPSTWNRCTASAAKQRSRRRRDS